MPESTLKFCWEQITGPFKGSYYDRMASLNAYYKMEN